MSCLQLPELFLVDLIQWMIKQHLFSLSVFIVDFTIIVVLLYFPRPRYWHFQALLCEIEEIPVLDRVHPNEHRVLLDLVLSRLERILTFVTAEL